ncbi:hypothetical protein DPMN_029065 [Dreissena polymorpha]|uniref:Uncharacterized protein n=1 Tax=Dreissena polymorpha TaxID=45954 RepID=A0A9D4LY23_DREPO|nr:hypothetical protein DPMN_029065 [Dreissena polymorpha]
MKFAGRIKRIKDESHPEQEVDGKKSLTVHQTIPKIAIWDDELASLELKRERASSKQSGKFNGRSDQYLQKKAFVDQLECILHHNEPDVCFWKQEEQIGSKQIAYDVVQCMGSIFVCCRNTTEKNVRIWFHQDWAKDVASRVLTW